MGLAVDETRASCTYVTAETYTPRDDRESMRESICTCVTRVYVEICQGVLGLRFGLEVTTMNDDTMAGACCR